ncbi:hypothetical protein HHI36_016189 [Cryptolaemus montrouzieri]|uniref:Uncharacterized protein n=1 Tax=Cryptolaemus montrouzieri TaxID=559131 RepID=A0ABD2NJR8_9CUCU
MWNSIIFAILMSIVLVSTKPTRSRDAHIWLQNRARTEILDPYKNNQPESYGMFLPNTASYKIFHSLGELQFSNT